MEFRVHGMPFSWDESRELGLYIELSGEMLQSYTVSNAQDRINLANQLSRELALDVARGMVAGANKQLRHKNVSSLPSRCREGVYNTKAFYEGLVRILESPSPPKLFKK